MKFLVHLCVLIVAIVTLFGKTVLSVSLEDDLENLVKKAEQVSGKSIKDAVNEVQKAFELIENIEDATGVDFVTLTDAASKDPKYFRDDAQDAVQDAGKVVNGESGYVPEGENYESIFKKAEKATGKKLEDIFEQGQVVTQLADQVEKATGKSIDKIFEEYSKYNKSVGDYVQKPVDAVKAELNAARQNWIKDLAAAKKRIIGSAANITKNVYGTGFNAIDKVSNATAALVKYPLGDSDAIAIVDHTNNLRQKASNKVRGVADGVVDSVAAAKKKIVNFNAGVANNIWSASSNAASDMTKGTKKYFGTLFAPIDTEED